MSQNRNGLMMMFEPRVMKVNPAKMTTCIDADQTNDDDDQQDEMMIMMTKALTIERCQNDDDNQMKASPYGQHDEMKMRDDDSHRMKMICCSGL